MQVCRLCKETKSLTKYQFRKDTSKYRTECKECLSKKNKQYRQEVKNGKRIPNKPLIVNNKITCSKCNIEQTLDKHSKYKNGIYKAECKKCAQTRINKYRRENEEHKDRYNTYQRERRITNTNYLLAGRCRTRINKLLTTSKNLDKFNNLVGCSLNEFKAHLENQFYGDMTWEKRNFVIDHIIPCSWFDLTNPKHLKFCFNYKNTQPLTRKDNGIKGNKVWVNYDLTKNPYI
jgi:hypothetical protein